MTTLLPLNLESFGHHHHKSAVLSLAKPRPLTFSTSTSISMPILCLDRIESFPIKSTGSLPDLYAMVSAATESRHRAASLNDTLNLSSSLPSASTPFAICPATSPHPLAQSKSISKDCSIPQSSSTMTVSSEQNSASSALAASSPSSNDLNNNCLRNGTSQPKNDASTLIPNSSDSLLPSESSAPDPQVASPGPRRRKSSSMAPVVPDFELMTKLATEDQQSEVLSQLEQNRSASCDICNVLGNHCQHLITNGEPVANGHNQNDELDDKADDIHHWKEYCGSEKESASAWLAAALKAPRSPQSRRKNGMMNGMVNGMMSMANGFSGNASSTLKLTSTETAKLYPSINITSSVPLNPSDNIKQYKCPAQAVTPISQTNCVSSSISAPTTKGANVDKPKILQPFKDDRVRRTSSILRPAAPLLSPPPESNCSKKKVSFADSMGKKLENVRYFVISPQVTRRYSSYHSPSSYLNNGNYNSPWNMAINQANNRTPLGTNNSLNTNYTVPQAQQLLPNPIKDYDFSHAKLAPRYELVASNFTSPSLQLNFTERLEAHSVLLHSLTTAETTVYGTVSVMNLHFTKRVVVRYTFNEWKSFIEREATYMLGSHDGRTDKFSFVIYARPEDFANNLAAAFSVHHAGTYLTNSQDPIQSIHPRVYFALRFTTGDGKEYWDNNDGRNYCLNLTTY